MKMNSNQKRLTGELAPKKQPKGKSLSSRNRHIANVKSSLMHLSTHFGMEIIIKYNLPNPRRDVICVEAYGEYFKKYLNTTEEGVEEKNKFRELVKRMDQYKNQHESSYRLEVPNDTSETESTHEALLGVGESSQLIATAELTSDVRDPLDNALALRAKQEKTTVG